MSFEPQINEGSRHFKLRRCDVAVFGLIHTSQRIPTGLDANLDDIQTACVCAQFRVVPGSHLFLAKPFTLSSIVWQKLAVARLAADVIIKCGNRQISKNQKMDEAECQEYCNYEIMPLCRKKRGEVASWVDLVSVKQILSKISGWQSQLLMFNTMHTVLTLAGFPLQFFRKITISTQYKCFHWRMFNFRAVILVKPCLVRSRNSHKIWRLCFLP